ncbi:histidine phosphotransferase family protein [Limimaricola variabilis]|uniref:histidine phosphotransferase family protein n=1 Tax=Limimaricola variabilis TaxID=1492771 RepID=UPI002AC8EDC1|nr:histidine phosphotransferase family protein [Limimaricola variabilis]WPY95453.1 histidine phosphotransferase family protein [Limimaricola variabilis]
MTDEPDLDALIASRLCHDLISPLSAIGNGVELLEMTAPPGPELSLIAESVEAAIARVRFFRLAFGAASSAQAVGRSEIVALLDGLSRGNRLRIEWEVAGSMRRDLLKLVLLLLCCAETALPHGGRIIVSGRPDAALRLRGHGPRFRIDAPAWERLRKAEIDPAAQPSEAQFAVAAKMLRAQARPVTIDTGEHGIEIAL